MRGLIEKVKKSDHITVLENVSIDRIMTDNNTIYGVIGRFTDDNVPDSNVIIQSSHVVLATGERAGRWHLMLVRHLRTWSSYNSTQQVLILA